MTTPSVTHSRNSSSPAPIESLEPNPSSPPPNGPKSTPPDSTLDGSLRPSLTLEHLMTATSYTAEAQGWPNATLAPLQEEGSNFLEEAQGWSNTALLPLQEAGSSFLEGVAEGAYDVAESVVDGMLAVSEEINLAASRTSRGVDDTIIEETKAITGLITDTMTGLMTFDPDDPNTWDNPVTTGLSETFNYITEHLSEEEIVAIGLELVGEPDDLHSFEELSGKLGNEIGTQVAEEVKAKLEEKLNELKTKLLDKFKKKILRSVTKNFVAKQAAKGAAGAIGHIPGLLATGVMIQADLERSSRAATDLKAEHPEFHETLKELGDYQYMYFLVDEHLAPFMEKIHEQNTPHEQTISLRHG